MNLYRKASEKYRPEKIKVLFIAESPPFFESEDKRSYFYFENNPGKDMLFATLMKACYGIDYTKNKGNKIKLLKRLMDDGIFLIDSVKYPINRDERQETSNKKREEIIQNEIPNLLNELNKLHIGSETKIILIKETVFNSLYSMLKQRGYNVLNKDKIGFPRYHKDKDVVKEIRNLLEINNHKS